MIKIFLLLAMVICSVSKAEAIEVKNVITLNSGYKMPVPRRAACSLIMKSSPGRSISLFKINQEIYL